MLAYAGAALPFGYLFLPQKEVVETRAGQAAPEPYCATSTPLARSSRCKSFKSR